MKILLGILILSLPAVAAPTLLEQYDQLLEKYPSPYAPIATCVTPKIKKNRETRRYQSALQSQFKANKPAVNFCGKFMVIAEPVTGGGDLFVADCASGKVQTIKAAKEGSWFTPYMKAGSCLLVEHEPNAKQAADDFSESAYGPPRLYVWQGKKLGKIDDPIWRVKK